MELVYEGDQSVAAVQHRRPGPDAPVLHEGLQAIFVNLFRPVVGREYFLLDQVVEARSHLRAPRRAVVEQLSTM